MQSTTANCIALILLLIATILGFYFLGCFIYLLVNPFLLRSISLSDLTHPSFRRAKSILGG